MKTPNNHKQTIHELSGQDQSCAHSRFLYPTQSPLIRETGRKAFTLVELIIVITILAILATLAFVSFQGYTSKSRDSNRASTAKNIETGLELFQTKSGVYPIQSTGATISLSGTPITVQGNLDESIARVINLNEVPKDPKTGDPYNYISDTKGRGGKVLYYLENTPDYAFLSQSYAESEARIAVVKGQGPGVLLDTGSQMVTKNVDLFGATQSGETFTILVSDGLKIPGTGLELGGGFQLFAEKGGRLDAPKSCPTGFIPVPGNAEFMQPGFCVAKYEMALERDLVGTGELNTDWNTRKGTTNTQSGTLTTWLDGPIVSAPGKYPIARITQTQAIAACQSIGGHLITNNEWMTIARDIEANGVNWSSGQVGSGYIFNGVSNSTLGCLATSDGPDVDTTITTDDIYTDLPYNRATKTGPGGNASCDTKRQLKLSNGEVIWDLAGNVWEHVNGRNTINGENFDTLIGNSCGEAVGWYSFTNNATDTVTQCHFTNGYSYEKYGPKIPNLNASNGMGRIYSTTYNNRVFCRGGGDNNINPVISGIYTLNLNPNNGFASVGFRCAF